jgi:C_GCAxxG_C_C family probable redox protein
MSISITMAIDIGRIRQKAEDYYRRGDFYCSEAIVKTIREEFGLTVSEEVVKLASGFPVGIGGAGCVCGAVVGGVMALGLFFGRTAPGDDRVKKTMALSRELHDRFKDKHKRTCCRVLTRGMTLGSPEHMEQCISLTGEVAEETARIILRESAAEFTEERRT